MRQQGDAAAVERLAQRRFGNEAVDAEFHNGEILSEAAGL
jgi:hypothetical protein